MEILKCDGISKYFGDVAALDDISFSVNSGEWVSIMGPSGAGKSTLVNILSLMDHVSSGIYEIAGVKANSLNKDEILRFRREKIGLIFQEFHLVSYLNALENVMINQYFHSSIDEESAKNTLEKVGLKERINHLPNELSGGEQQRVCIARALINEPDIIIADEPTGNLDEKNEQIVLEIFKNLKKEGKTLILITHNPYLGRFGDKIIWLKHGKLDRIQNLKNEQNKTEV